MSEDYRNIPVKFFYRDVKQNFESKKQGKPIWKTLEFISIMKPGNSKDIMEREVKPLDIERWGRIYKAWKNREEEIQVGTRLEVLPDISQIQIEGCKALNIFTLEQLINSDIDNQKTKAKFDSLAIDKEKKTDLMRDAKKYLQGFTAVGIMEEEVLKITVENEKLKSENTELKERINELINNGAERGERDTTKSGTNDSHRKPRPIRNTSVIHADKDRAGVAGAT